LNVAAAISVAASVLAMALLALAARRLARVIQAGPGYAPLPPRRLPPLLAGWVGLVTFAVGMYLGRVYWH
jgi:hypothetical protein